MARMAARAITAAARRARGTRPRAPPPGACTARRWPRTAGTAATGRRRSAAGSRAAWRAGARAAGRWPAAARRPARRTPAARARSAPAGRAAAGAGTGRRARSPPPARRAGCARSPAEPSPQLADLAAGDRQLGAVAHDHDRRAVDLGADLDGAPQVDDERPVHAHEAVGVPALLQVGEAGAQQIAPLVGHHADVVAVGLQVEDRLAR